tara:strand:+ start:269 stop:952 length:684 start_codon:yes stop_codon:yes gene_type:complete
MDYKEVLKKTKKIIINLHKLNNNVHKLKKKIIQLNKINSSFKNNTNFKQEENNLVFQSDILKNELKYYNNIYNIFLDKYSKDLYELSEYILIILISLTKLEIENKSSINSIFSKIVYTTQITSLSSEKLKEIINNIINNLKIIDEFIALIEKYLEKLSINNKTKNIHNNNFELNIQYKRDSIILEFKKHCDKFIKSLEYFRDSSETVINQIETSKLLNFFLNLKRDK